MFLRDRRCIGMRVIGRGSRIDRHNCGDQVERDSRMGVRM